MFTTYMPHVTVCVLNAVFVVANTARTDNTSPLLTSHNQPMSEWHASFTSFMLRCPSGDAVDTDEDNGTFAAMRADIDALRARRRSDALKRLRRVKAAAQRRQKDLAERAHAFKAREQRAEAVKQRRAARETADLAERTAAKQRVAAERREALAAMRAEQRAAAERRREAIRERTAAMREAHAIFVESGGFDACARLQPITELVIAAMGYAKASHDEAERARASKTPPPKPANHDDVPLPKPGSMHAPSLDAAALVEESPGRGEAVPVSARVKCYADTPEGRAEHKRIMNTLEDMMMRDTFAPCALCGCDEPATQTCRAKPRHRHEPALAAAAIDLLDSLLAAAGAVPTPRVSPAKPRCVPPPLDADDEATPDRAVAAAAPTPPVPSATTPATFLSSPDNRRRAGRFLVAAHHAAVQRLAPTSHKAFRERLAAALAPDDAEHLSDLRAMSTGLLLVRQLADLVASQASSETDDCSISAGSNEATPTRTPPRQRAAASSTTSSPSASASAVECSPTHTHISHRGVLRLLAAWEEFAAAMIDADALTKKRHVAQLRHAYVRLRLAEHDRASDIARKKAIAAAAGAASPQARRERLVAPRRAALNAAVSSQLASMTRRLRAAGGASAVAAADAEVAATLEARSHVDVLPDEPDVVVSCVCEVVEDDAPSTPRATTDTTTAADAA